MSLRYHFAISSQAPIIWKDNLFITSVWRFFAANGEFRFATAEIVLKTGAMPFKIQKSQECYSWRERMSLSRVRTVLPHVGKGIQDSPGFWIPDFRY